MLIGDTSHFARQDEVEAAWAIIDPALGLDTRPYEYTPGTWGPAEADHLATQPATIESKQGISCNCTAHYRYFSKLYAQEAKDAEMLAAHHEQLVEGYKSGSGNQ